MKVRGAGSSLKAENCTFRESEGAGVLIQEGATGELTDSNAQNCARGWDVMGAGSKLTASGSCSVSGNQLAGARVLSGGRATFAGACRLDNSATSYGLYVNGAQSTATFRSGSISANHACNIMVSQGGSATLEGVACNRSASDNGFKVQNANSRLTAHNCSASKWVYFPLLLTCQVP